MLSKVCLITASLAVMLLYRSIIKSVVNKIAFRLETASAECFNLINKTVDNGVSWR